MYCCTFLKCYSKNKKGGKSIINTFFLMMVNVRLKINSDTLSSKYVSTSVQNHNPESKFGEAPMLDFN